MQEALDFLRARCYIHDKPNSDTFICRWCGVFEGLDHSRRCAIAMLELATPKVYPFGYSHQDNCSRTHPFAWACDNGLDTIARY